MSFFADLHIHSKYSRATSKDLTLEELAYWGQLKGLALIGTGDFTHPAWLKEIKEKLVPAEPGLFRLRPDLEQAIEKRLPAACRAPLRFVLQVEISTIYKKGDRTRKVHHLVLAPDLERAETIIAKLSKIGNLKSDGRPILGLDSRHLLEIVLEVGNGSFLIPAHIWTPWFSALGSKSGFDSIQECYADLAQHVFAVETGLSSDPAMNWRLSNLDRYRLVSNSDAHSAPNLGREATAFDTPLDYFAMRQALETGQGYGGTVEFFPEEGKYHFDGHRKCGIRLTPGETKANKGLCPHCGHPVTVGVLYRVCELADRPEGFKPENAAPVHHFVTLPSILSEVQGSGSASQAVQTAYHQLLQQWGSEFFILDRLPSSDLEKSGFSLLSEALRRMREGKVVTEPGYDGEYGVVKLFKDSELKSSSLFTVPEGVSRKEPKAPQKPAPKVAPAAQPRQSPALSPAGLDAEQEAAAEVAKGPLLILAGPGTGKTRTLTHRMARLVSEKRLQPGQCLAITFTRRAVEEMKERLEKLLPAQGAAFPVMTFHSLGHLILRENEKLLGFPKPFKVASVEEQLRLLKKQGLSERKGRHLLKEISQSQRSQSAGEGLPEDLKDAYRAFQSEMKNRSWVSFDGLIAFSVQLLQEHPKLQQHYRQRWPWVSIDEFQDVDAGQYALVRLLAPPSGNVCAIGDPDQAIYGFRGGDAGSFTRFANDFTGCQTLRISQNYRSVKPIVEASLQVIAPSSRVEDRVLRAVINDPTPITLNASPTERSEAEFVVKTIEKLIGGSGFFSMDSGRVESHEGASASLSFSDFAVLYRTDAQSQALVKALSNSGLPFQKRSHAGLNDSPFVQALLDDLAHPDETKTFHQAFEEALLEAGKMEQADPAIGEALKSLAARCKGFEEFASQLALGLDADLWDPRADRVSLLTLHASKGLEFPVVFIVGCEDGLLPLKWGDSEGGDIGEERRLLFVGMTRAQRRLYLCRAQKRLWRGTPREMEPSPFLREIEEKLLERSADKLKSKPKRDQLKLF